MNSRKIRTSTAAGSWIVTVPAERAAVLATLTQLPALGGELVDDGWRAPDGHEQMSDADLLGAWNAFADRQQ